MLGADGLKATLSGLAGTENPAQFSAAVHAFTHSLKVNLTALLSFTAAGMLAGYFLTRWLIRRNMARRTLSAFLLQALVDSVLAVLLTGICAWLATLWRPSILLSTLFSVIFFGAVSLLEAYLIHGRKKVTIKSIVNFKNIFKLFATNLIIFLLSAVLVAAVVFLVNVIVGVFVGIAILEIAFIVIALNAEAYVKKTAEKASAEKIQMEETAEK